MNKRTLSFCALAAVVATGCNHPMARGPESAAVAPVSTSATTTAVPLPAQTPFDGNPKAKAAYLEFYALGYRIGVTDHASAGCLCGSEGSTEYYEASMSGFLAGKEAGLAAFAQGRKQNQSPAAATMDAPTALPPSSQR